MVRRPGLWPRQPAEVQCGSDEGIKVDLFNSHVAGQGIVATKASNPISPDKLFLTPIADSIFVDNRCPSESTVPSKLPTTSFPSFQIHQAQRSPCNSGDCNKPWPRNLHIEPASDWKDARFEFARWPRAELQRRVSFEGCLPGVQVIQEISGDQTGRGAPGGMRRQAYFRVRDLHFTVCESLTALVHGQSATVHAVAPLTSKKARESFRIGTRALGREKLSAEHSMHRIGRPEQWLQVRPYQRQ